MSLGRWYAEADLGDFLGGNLGISVASANKNYLESLPRKCKNFFIQMESYDYTIKKLRHERRKVIHKMHNYGPRSQERVELAKAIKNIEASIQQTYDRKNAINDHLQKCLKGETTYGPPVTHGPDAFVQTQGVDKPTLEHSLPFDGHSAQYYDMTHPCDPGYIMQRGTCVKKEPGHMYIKGLDGLEGPHHHHHHGGGGSWRGGGWWGGPGYGWGPDIYADYPVVVTVPVLAIETPDAPVVEVMDVQEPQEDSQLLGLLDCCL